ncbi:LYR motif-containing protein 1 [Armadillidium nasatum]|uniref:LYR motif-containing protein 1 n=1 Tax=Armadillidium nasatum TaxID=96803 RepID=A0A5N5SLX9_9CRUS|nr:LYR motif-containing protein 1 [Armadillidium nasatum]
MSLQIRREVLSLYKRILRLSLTWEAKEPSKTKEERIYIRTEARTLFRKNKDVSDEREIREMLTGTEARVEMGIHYRLPYPRPVNLPPNICVDLKIIENG